MASSYGKNITVSIFGQSHSKAIGVSIDGLPAGFELNVERLRAFMARRAPGRNALTTARRESDGFEFISGLVDLVTCGAPVAAIIENRDTRPADYEQIRDIPRPSHADYSAFAKYGRAHDIRGGGHFSGRLTAPLCLAGGICLQLLEREGIEVFSHIFSVADIKDEPFDPVNIEQSELSSLQTSDFPVISPQKKERMETAINEALRQGDSLGGIIECASINLPAGLGEPMFEGMENRISSVIFGIPAVKGIEFGNGFGAALLKGSENNDGFYIKNDEVRTRTNNHGGILGGITTGMPLIFRVAIKPTPSIAKEQESVSLSGREGAKLEIKGRHDPCILPRAAPCVEAAAAIAIYDALLDYRKYKG